MRSEQEARQSLNKIFLGGYYAEDALHQMLTSLVLVEEIPPGYAAKAGLGSPFPFSFLAIIQPEPQEKSMTSG